jgi:hypothetical protein
MLKSEASGARVSHLFDSMAVWKAMTRRAEVFGSNESSGMGLLGSPWSRDASAGYRRIRSANAAAGRRGLAGSPWLHAA